MNFKGYQCALVAGVIAAVGASASASIVQTELTGATPLVDILDPQGNFQGEFVVGDKLFTNIVFVGGGIDASQVTIAPFLAANPDDATGFDLIGQWVDVPGDAFATGFSFRYDVVVLDPNKEIKDASLIFNATTAGTGSSDVNETLTTLANEFVDELDVIVNQFEETREDTWLTDGPTYDGLNAFKDFSVFAPGENDFAGVSFIRQTFSQVPAPGAAVLAGLAGVVGIRRRRG
jgi:MYXO-CTERM domain-containing protein